MDCSWSKGIGWTDSLPRRWWGRGTFFIKVPNNVVDFNTSKNNITTGNLILAAGGGGGGARGSSEGDGENASGGTSLLNNGAGGSGGAYGTGGGGGFISNGGGNGHSQPATRFTGGYGFKTSALTGGQGHNYDGTPTGQLSTSLLAHGGFGGGGGNSVHAGAGGGGAHGGDGANPYNSDPNGHAGTSYISGGWTGSNYAYSNGYQTGHGKVIITAVGEQTTFYGGTYDGTSGSGNTDPHVDPQGWFGAKAFNH